MERSNKYINLAVSSVSQVDIHQLRVPILVSCVLSAVFFLKSFLLNFAVSQMLIVDVIFIRLCLWVADM